MMEFLFDLATQFLTCGLTGWYFYRRASLDRLTGGLIDRRER